MNTPLHETPCPLCLRLLVDESAGDVFEGVLYHADCAKALRDRRSERQRISGTLRPHDA